MQLRPVEVFRVESPCKKCKTNSHPAHCAEDCEKVKEFILWLDHNHVMSFGSVDTTDDTGHRLLPQ